MKQTWKPGNMLYPLPVVLVSTRGLDGKDNLITVAWAGTVCTNPPMLSISVKKIRYSYQALHDTGVFVVNLTTKVLVKATDYCGVRSGRDEDKWERLKLTKEEADLVPVSMVGESPVNIECRVVEEKELGSHVMFLAKVVNVHVDDRYMDEKGRFCLEKAEPIVYSHGVYFNLDQKLGTFGYSVKKPEVKKPNAKKPEAKKPDAKKPNAKKPDSSMSGYKKPRKKIRKTQF